MTAWISNRTEQFSYFDRQLGHPDWPSATVLDFGGNVGNILLGPECSIAPQRYWCVDIVKDAITKGQELHPLAHFVFYDRYNVEYNPTGRRDMPVPDLGQRFDIILAYSVFTHTSRGEMRTLVDQLRALLTADGVLAFTFIDPYFHPPEGWTREDEAPGLDNLPWLLTLGQSIPRLADAAGGTRLTWDTFVTDVDLLAGQWNEMERPQCLSVCTEEHMRVIYPDAEVLPPIHPERQSCCVLRRP